MKMVKNATFTACLEAARRYAETVDALHEAGKMFQGVAMWKQSSRSYVESCDLDRRLAHNALVSTHTVYCKSCPVKFRQSLSDIVHPSDRYGVADFWLEQLKKEVS